MAPKKKNQPTLPPLGSRVRMRFGVEDVIAEVIEHRGPLGVGGRELVRVRFQLDGANEAFESEVPLEELTVVDPAA